MARTWDDADLALAFDSLGEAAGVALRQDFVFSAPKQQRQRLDKRQALLEPRVAERPEGPRRGLARACLLDRPLDRVDAGWLLLEHLPFRGIGAEQRWHIFGALRPRIRHWLPLVEEAPRCDEREPPHGLWPDRRHLQREGRPDRAARDVRAREPRLGKQLADRQYPVEMAVEHGVAGGAGESRQRRNDHLAVLRERVEERNPPRQSAEAREESQLGAAALAPDAGREPVDLDALRRGLGHGRAFGSVVGGARLGPERRHRRAELLLHRLGPPAVLPLGEQVLELRHHLLREQLRVVAREVFGHVAELQQQHEMTDVEVDRDLFELFGDLVGRADDDVAALDDLRHLAGEELELVLVAGRRGSAGGLRHLALNPRALCRLAGIAWWRRVFRADVEAAAVEILRGLRVELQRLLAGRGDAHELQKARAIGVPVLAEARHLLPEAVDGRAAGLVAVIGEIAVDVIHLRAPLPGLD